MAEIGLGTLFILAGLAFLLIPLDMLRKVFPRMRSKIFTKIGGAGIVIGGLAMILVYCL